MTRGKCSLVAHMAIWDGDVAASFHDGRWSSTRAMSLSGSSFQNDSVADDDDKRETLRGSFLRRRRFRLFRRRQQKADSEVASSAEESIRSLRTSRVHVPDGKPLLQKQKAVVYCRPSLAEAALDNGGSLSDSECSSVCSVKNRFLRQASRISALTTEVGITPSAAIWDPFATPNLLGPREKDDDDNVSVSSEPSNGLMAVEVHLSFDDDFSLFSALSNRSGSKEKIQNRAQSVPTVDSTSEGSILPKIPSSFKQSEATARQYFQNVTLDSVPESPCGPHKSQSAPPPHVEREATPGCLRTAKSAPQPHLLRKQDMAEPVTARVGVEPMANCMVSQSPPTVPSTPPLVQPKSLSTISSQELAGTNQPPHRDQSPTPSHVLRKLDFAETYGQQSPRRPAARENMRTETQTEFVVTDVKQIQRKTIHDKDIIAVLDKPSVSQQDVQPGTLIPGHEDPVESSTETDKSVTHGNWQQREPTSTWSPRRKVVSTITPRISNCKTQAVSGPEQQNVGSSRGPRIGYTPPRNYTSLSPPRTRTQVEMVAESDIVVGTLRATMNASPRESSSHHRRQSKGLTFQPSRPALPLGSAQEGVAPAMGSSNTRALISETLPPLPSTSGGKNVVEAPSNSAPLRKPPPKGTWRRKQNSNGSLTDQPVIPDSASRDVGAKPSEVVEEFSISDLMSSREEANIDKESASAADFSHSWPAGRRNSRSTEDEIACDPRFVNRLSRLNTPVISNRTPPVIIASSPISEKCCASPRNSPQDASCSPPPAQLHENEIVLLAPLSLERALTDTDSNDQPQLPSRKVSSGSRDSVPRPPKRAVTS